MTGSCNHDNEFSGCIKFVNFLINSTNVSIQGLCFMDSEYEWVKIKFYFSFRNNVMGINVGGMGRTCCTNGSEEECLYNLSCKS